MILRPNKHAFIAILLFILVIGCNNKKQDSKILVVTIEPQRYFLKQIVENKFEIISLVPAGSNPESFSPAPSQMVALDKSLAYFKVGFLGVENTLVEKMKDDSNLNLIDCSTGIDIIKETHLDDDNEHSHAHMGGDPHYWSSINSSKVIIKNMYNAILKLDESNKEYYTRNYNKALEKINKTDSIIKNLIASSDSKAFIIYHPALSYFAQEYGLTQLSIEQDGKNPSPSQLKTLIDTAKKQHVKSVLIQHEFDIKNAEVVAKQLGVSTHSINLLSYDWHDEMIRIAQIITGAE